MRQPSQYRVSCISAHEHAPYAAALKPSWPGTHTLGEPGKKRSGSFFFILTEKDIVAVWSPKEVHDIETLDYDRKPVSK